MPFMPNKVKQNVIMRTMYRRGPKPLRCALDVENNANFKKEYILSTASLSELKTLTVSANVESAPQLNVRELQKPIARSSELM